MKGTAVMMRIRIINERAFQRIGQKRDEQEAETACEPAASADTVRPIPDFFIRQRPWGLDAGKEILPEQRHVVAQHDEHDAQRHRNEKGRGQCLTSARGAQRDQEKREHHHIEHAEHDDICFLETAVIGAVRIDARQSDPQDIDACGDGEDYGQKDIFVGVVIRLSLRSQ